MLFQTANLAILTALCVGGPPGREQLAEEVGKALDGINAITLEVEVHVEAPYLARRVQAFDNQDLHIRIAAERGGKLRVEAFRSGCRQWLLLSDGKQVVEWADQEKTWTRYPMPTFDSEYAFCLRYLLIQRDPAASVRGTSPLEGADGMGPWLRHVAESSRTHLLGRRRSAGAESIVLERKYDHEADSPGSQWFSETARWYVDPRTYMLSRYKRVYSSGVGPVRLMKGTEEVRYTHITVNPDLPDELFTFDPPKGGVYIDPDGLRLMEASLEGKPAPELSLPDLDGKTVALGDFRGKKTVLLVFWATWCAPCNQEMPFLIRLHQEYADRNVTIIGVSIDRRSAGLKSYVARKGLPYQNLHDGDGETAKTYGAMSIPHTFLIDRSGIVVRIWQGWHGDQEEKEIRAELAKLLKQ